MPSRLCAACAVALLLGGLLLGACRPASPSAGQPALPTARVAAPTTPSLIVPAGPVLIATPSATLVPSATPPPPTPTTRPADPAGQAFPLKTAGLEFGAVAHLFYTERYAPLVAARDAGFGWVRQQIHWRDQEGPRGNYAWGELDQIVAAVNAHGLKLLISVVQSPSFYSPGGHGGLPANPQSLAAFVGALAAHYKGQVHAIEIWNEQNLAIENGGAVALKHAGHYVEVLRACYASIKAVDPSIYVLAGPPASTAVNDPGLAVDDMSYYRAMYRYQNGVIRNYMDAQAVHPGGSANPPETLWPEAPSPAEGWTEDRTFYFRHIEDVRALMEEFGMGGHQIWITEFGWATRNNSPGFEFGNQVSYEQQAEYIVGAMRMTRERYPWVGAMFLWNLNFGPLKARDGDPYHEQASFSILDANYSPRPAYWAIQQYIGEVRAAAP